MPPAALALALAAAFLHACWNLLAARSRDPEAALAVAMSLGPALMIPLAVATWRIEAAALPWIVASCALETVYLVLLARGYGSSEMSLIYPIARGTAPVFVLVAGAILLGQAVALVAAVGIAVVATGVLLVRGVRSRASLRHVALALAIAGIIASYTLVDKQGLRYADPLPYAVIVTGIPGAILLAWVLARSGRARVRAVLTPGIVAASLCGIVAYGFVLGALAIAPAAAMVSAVRETSVVMATALAALVLHERVARSRWIGAIVVTAGVVLVVLG